MFKELKNAAVSLILLTIITGAIYPLLVTGIAQLAFNRQANGSLLPEGRGSTLIGQPIDDPKYFWSRLSGASYNASASSGTNFSQTNPALVDAAKARIAALKAIDPTNTNAIPVDLVTASASGLDPNISVAAAEYQADRIARVRGIDPAKVHQLIEEYTESSLLGDSCVNALEINLALDGKLPVMRPRQDEAGARGKAFLPE